MRITYKILQVMCNRVVPENLLIVRNNSYVAEALSFQLRLGTQGSSVFPCMHT